VCRALRDASQSAGNRYGVQELESGVIAFETK
jgi:hypothetical protein